MTRFSITTIVRCVILILGNTLPWRPSEEHLRHCIRRCRAHTTTHGEKKKKSKNVRFHFSTRHSNSNSQNYPPPKLDGRSRPIHPLIVQSTHPQNQKSPRQTAPHSSTHDDGHDMISFLFLCSAAHLSFRRGVGWHFVPARRHSVRLRRCSRSSALHQRRLCSLSFKRRGPSDAERRSKKARVWDLEYLRSQGRGRA